MSTMKEMQEQINSLKEAVAAGYKGRHTLRTMFLELADSHDHMLMALQKKFQRDGMSDEEIQALFASARSELERLRTESIQKKEEKDVAAEVELPPIDPTTVSFPEGARVFGA